MAEHGLLRGPKPPSPIPHQCGSEVAALRRGLEGEPALWRGQVPAPVLLSCWPRPLCSCTKQGHLYANPAGGGGGGLRGLPGTRG